MTERASRPTAPESVRVLAPGKINPWLDVFWKRADGYHELETYLVAIDLCDLVTVTRATRDARAERADVALSVSGPCASPDIPLDGRNLAVRAAEAVLARARASSRLDPAIVLDVHLEKRVPSQAGLGGASADAAAAWTGATAVLGLDARLEDAYADLAAMGSDTVFFAAAAETGTAWCRGRGEIVVPDRAMQHPWSIALVTPAVGAPTAAVYAALGMSLRGVAPVPTVRRVDWSSTSAHDARFLLGNRLEPAALAAVGELARWRRVLDDAGAAHFRLSGSGSSFFGLYEDDADARSGLDRIAAAARAVGLASRVCDVVHPCGHGARLLRIP